MKTTNGIVNGLAAYHNSNTKKYEDNYEKIFGKKEIPHGRIKKEEIKEVKVNHKGITFKGGEPTKEEAVKIFKNDIQQPYTKEGKINGDFIKVYGKNNHPHFNKEITKIDKR